MQMRLALALLAGLAIALPAAAQTGGGASGSSGGAQGPSGQTASSSLSPRMATSHAETARRLMGRQGAQAAGLARTKSAPEVAAAAKAADDALLADPTLKAMINGSMAQPPSLAGGSPNPAPPPPKGQ